MSQSQIQSFLVDKNSSLATYKDQGVNDSQPQLASTIIYNAAQAWGINPQVLLATMQKEQSLVTKQNPTSIDYRSAMGYGCPDGADCNASYYGFANQVNIAAYQFRYNYEALKGNSSFTDGDGDPHPVGKFACAQADGNHTPPFYDNALLPGNTVTFSRNTAISGTVDTTVTLANEATASLLCYTPHVGPYNSTGYSGSDNFVYWFTQWFGSTQGFVSLDTPRWMVLTTTTAKQYPGLDQAVGSPINSGTALFFVDKVIVNGVWYLRTSYDSNYNSYAGIPIQDLSDIQPTALDNPGYMHLTSDRNKWNPITGIVDAAAKIPSGTDLFFVDKITINGADYYRTSYDQKAGANSYITATAIQSISYTKFEDPRYMQVDNDTTKLDPLTDTTGDNVTSGTQDKFTSKILVNGSYYYRTDTDTTSNTSMAIPAKDVTEIPYKSIGDAKWVQLDTSTYRYSPRTLSQIEDYVDKNISPQIFISQQISVNGSLYYRTAWSQQNNQDAVIPASAVSDIPFIGLETPRSMSLKVATKKVNPYTGQSVGVVLPAGYTLPYATKVYVNGMWYLRTQSDTTNNIINAIPIDKLNT